LGNASKSVRHGLVRAIALALPVVLSSWAYAQTFSADAVKAAFLHRFASYVAWPADAIGEGAFVIAVAGGNDVALHLEELLPQMTLQGRPAEVRRVSRGTDLNGVHILFVGRDMLVRARDLRAAAMARPILVVTDGDDGLDDGAVVNFVESANRVRFEISLTAAERAGLRIDSALLSVAARVEPRP
jgi:hypothetical protein